jgi:hypothetical protein
VSDLADLAADVTGDMPVQVRKVINAAIEHGWELNKPGMTLALRLNHPTDELADPVYITWTVGRTPTGRLSFKFMSCATRGLVPLSGADLLEYLEDPTVAYMTDEDVKAADVAQASKEAAKEPPAWDKRKDQMSNLQATIGASVLRVETPRSPRASKPQAPAKPVSGAPLRVAAPALRVQAPKA